MLSRVCVNRAFREGEGEGGSFLEYQHFKMESLQTALDLCTLRCYLGSLDLSDAYYSVPIHPEDRKFLRFRWEGEMLQ